MEIKVLIQSIIGVMTLLLHLLDFGIFVIQAIHSLFSKFAGTNPSKT